MPASLEHVKKEREKAKSLRKTRWWREKLKQGICYHCEKKFPPAQLSMDHLHPLIKGGKTGKNNTVTSCKACNSEKGHKTLVQMKLDRK